MTAEALVARLRQDDVLLAVAESCTGGMLGAAITDVPGASKVFVGGVIAYADAAKKAALGLTDVQLAAGAVSAVVVEAMAHAARERLGADMGIGISGVAGPDGGRDGKPVGTVWIAVAGPGDLIEAHRLALDGDRATIRAKAVAAAIDHALAALEEAENEELV